MTNQLIPGTGRKRFLVYTIAVLGILFPFSVKAQTTWTVTVDVSSLNKKPVYKVGLTASGANPCPYTAQDQSHPEALKVCPGDKVLWTATTSSGTYDMYVYLEDAKLISTGGLVHVTPASSVGGTVSSLKPAGSYEYYVAIVDQTSGRLFIDDPKIVIGTGTNMDSLINIEQKAEALSKSLTVGKSVTQEQKKDAQQIVDDVRALLDRLQ
jgi:hypothetical protein